MPRKLRRRPSDDPVVAGMSRHERAYVMRARDADGERYGCAIVAATSARGAVARLRRMEPGREGALSAVLARNADAANLEEARDAEARWTASRECSGCGAVIWTVHGEMHEDLCKECR